MSKLIMFFDTETTDKWDFKAAYNHPNQPNLVQLGYKIYDQQRSVLFETGHLIDATVLPDWKGINPEAQNVHKIDTLMIQMYGMDPQLAMSQFQFWAEKCGLFVAHNAQFDRQIMQCFASRVGFSPEVFSTGVEFCTMKFTTNICKIPSPKGFGNKWPKLDEAYRSIVDKNGFADAHNALVDVNACADIFWKLQDKGLLEINMEADRYAVS